MSVTQIWILMALALSPQKYLKGKFCFICLKSLCEASHKLFNLYKNIIDRNTVNVHSDYRVYATELINFLSVIITTRVKNEIVKKELNKKYSYKQIFRMLSKYKKVRIDKDAPWEDVTKLKYIEELTKTVDVQGLKYGIL